MHDCKPLSPSERDRLSLAETAITNSLKLVRDEHLFRETYADFASYCQNRWTLDVAQLHFLDSQSEASAKCLDVQGCDGAHQAVQSAPGYLASLEATFASGRPRPELLLLALVVLDEASRQEDGEQKDELQHVAHKFLTDMWHELTCLALPSVHCSTWSSALKARAAMMKVAGLVERLIAREAAV